MGSDTLRRGKRKIGNLLPAHAIVAGSTTRAAALRRGLPFQGLRPVLCVPAGRPGAGGREAQAAAAAPAARRRERRRAGRHPAGAGAWRLPRLAGRAGRAHELGGFLRGLRAAAAGARPLAGRPVLRGAADALSRDRAVQVHALRLGVRHQRGAVPPRRGRNPGGVAPGRLEEAGRGHAPHRHRRRAAPVGGAVRYGRPP